MSPDDGSPFDVEALVNYLDDNVAEARRLHWVVSINGERRFAVKPVGAFASQIYDMLAALVTGHVASWIVMRLDMEGRLFPPSRAASPMEAEEESRAPVPLL